MDTREISERIQDSIHKILDEDALCEWLFKVLTHSTCYTTARILMYNMTAYPQLKYTLEDWNNWDEDGNLDDSNPTEDVVPLHHVDEWHPNAAYCIFDAETLENKLGVSLDAEDYGSARAALKVIDKNFDKIVNYVQEQIKKYTTVRYSYPELDEAIGLITTTDNLIQQYTDASKPAINYGTAIKVHLLPGKVSNVVAPFLSCEGEWFITPDGRYNFRRYIPENKDDEYEYIDTDGDLQRDRIASGTVYSSHSKDELIKHVLEVVTGGKVVSVDKLKELGFTDGQQVKIDLNKLLS